MSVTEDQSIGCPGCQKGQPWPGVHQAQHCQLIVSLCTALVRPWVLVCTLECLNARRTSDYYSVLEEVGDQDCKRSQGQDLWGAAEDIWLVQFGEEKAEGCTPCNLQLPQGEAEEEVLISTWRPATGHEEIEWSCFEGSSDWIPRKYSFLREWSVTAAVTQGSGQGTKPVRVQGAPGWHSEPYSLMLGSPVRSRECDLMILMGPFILEIFSDSIYFKEIKYVLCIMY